MHTKLIPKQTMNEIDIRVDDDQWRDMKGVEDIVERALTAGRNILSKPGNVSVLLTDNSEMQRLNTEFRRKDKPTDVLSFPADSMDAPFLGDIAVGYGVSKKDAVAAGKLLSDHLSHLVVHGYLHLLGYDHENDADAKEMEALERKVLASLGIADPYSPT